VLSSTASSISKHPNYTSYLLSLPNIPYISQKEAMAFPDHSIISSADYNNLPHIADASQVPIDHSVDLQELRSLLVKHNVPNHVCIRLVHKHFDVNPGEIMMIKSLDIPNRGHLSVLRPQEAAANAATYGIHYMVDNDGQLRPYEYSTSPVPDLSPLKSFLAEFCQAVLQRGLQKKLGLKFSSDMGPGKVGWTEFEFPNDRSTMMIPSGWPTPEGDYDFNVATEFHANAEEDEEGCSHTSTKCVHCTHSYKHPNELFVAGRKVELDSPFYQVYSAVVEAW
jgi:hypothetical protein